MPRRCKNSQCQTELPPASKCEGIVSKRGFCSVECLAEHSRDKLTKAKKRKQRKEVRKAKERLKTRSELARDAQRDFNAFIRERDRDLPCISCDKVSPGGDAIGGLWDCSHYRSVGACPELRFEELNAHKACKQCNRDKSGNIVEYRIRLIKRIGQDALDWLEGPHEPKKYTADELRELAAYYRKKARELKKQ